MEFVDRAIALSRKMTYQTVDYEPGARFTSIDSLTVWLIKCFYASDMSETKISIFVARLSDIRTRIPENLMCATDISKIIRLISGI